MKKKQLKHEKASSSIIIKSGANGNPRQRLLIATPTLGIVRMEWVVSRYGQVVPPNWAAVSSDLGIGNCVPMHYLVADAQNLACKAMIEQGFEWLLLWEDDVVAPFDSFLKLNEYMREEKYPVVSGLYFLKGNWSEPLLYRGNGNSCFTDFKIGDLVWASAVPTGFLLIHSSIIKELYKTSPLYETIGKQKIRKVFETPAQLVMETQTYSFAGCSGTSDITWCKRVMEENVFNRTKWKSLARKKYPFLCDTSIFCKHIDLQSGISYPEGV
jgi:hypothetical protein